jgi:hypothetical protein
MGFSYAYKRSDIGWRDTLQARTEAKGVWVWDAVREDTHLGRGGDGGVGLMRCVMTRTSARALQTHVMVRVFTKHHHKPKL